MIIVWREWYAASAIARMEAMGTLPRNEYELDEAFGSVSRRSVASLIAADEFQSSGADAFKDGGTIVIIEPPQYAGTYEITVDYEPRFHASLINAGAAQTDAS